MDQPLVELGLGGGLALLVIREVISFLRTQKQHRAARADSNPPDRSAGERSVEFWGHEIGEIVTEQLGSVVVPQLRDIRSNQDKIIASQADSRSRMIELSIRMATTLEQIRDLLRDRERERGAR